MHELAQLNVARMRQPLEHESMADFVAQLDPINALADTSEGFVWRLQDDAGNATEIRMLNDDQLLVNMSVWSSLDALKNFVYRTDHADVMRRKRHWFHRHAEIYLVLWWVTEGHRPTIEEAEHRLKLLRAKGPGPEAFDFGHTYPPPEKLSGPKTQGL